MLTAIIKSWTRSVDSTQVRLPVVERRTKLIDLFSVAAVLVFLVTGGTTGKAQHLIIQKSGALPKFDTATVKPTDPFIMHAGIHGSDARIVFSHYNLRQLVAYAYGAKIEGQVEGGPKWADDAYFDIVGKYSDDEAKSLALLPGSKQHRQECLMMQSLLQDRFGLHIEVTQKLLPALALVVNKKGSKLVPDDEAKKTSNLSITNGRLMAKRISMNELASVISSQPEADGRIVVNQTKLNGLFSFSLQWDPERADGVSEGIQDAPGLITALSSQLGLHLKSTKVLVDSVEITGTSKPDAD